MKATVKSTKGSRTPYMIYFALCGALALYFTLTGGDPGDLNAARGSGSGSDVGGTTSGGGGGGTGTTNSGQGQSIFDSNIFLSGQPKKGIEDPKGSTVLGPNDEPDVLDPADKDNPKNPQTGRPYSNSSMRQFTALRKRFPDNSIIPSKKTPEQIQKAKEDKMKMYALQSQVVTGKAQPEDINKYYEFRTKPVRDRIELLSYVVEKYKDKMAPNIKAQYTKILKMNRKVLENHEKAKAKAMEKSGN